MTEINRKAITVEILINAPVEKVWEDFTNAEKVKGWSFASDDWCVGETTNDLQIGGKFKTEMKSKDGKFGFDFEGLYTDVEANKKICYEMSDGRKVEVIFEQVGVQTKLTETFDMENENPEEMQKNGWQSILENFKKFVEKN